jgi:hypothetical protein
MTYLSKGQFSIFYPINKEVSRQIEEAIFEKLNDIFDNYQLSIDAEMIILFTNYAL